LTQSGHWPDQHVRPKLIAPPQFAPVYIDREILKQKQEVVARQLQAAKSYRPGRLKRNQDFLKDKSSAAQSLPGTRRASIPTEAQTEPVMQTDKIRRSSTGIIDIENYRQEALPLQPRTEFFKRMGLCPITAYPCEGDLSHLCEEYGCARKGGLSPRSEENL
jgi:hypothetical protein